MSNKIRITSPSEYTIEVNDKGDTISIDFADVNTLKNYTEVLSEFEEIRKEMQVSGKSAIELGKSKDLDVGVASEEMSKMVNTLDRAYGLVDKLFGEGASEKVFGGKKTVTGILDFFSQIEPHIKKAMDKVSKQADSITEKYAGEIKDSKVLK